MRNTTRRRTDRDQGGGRGLRRIGATAVLLTTVALTVGACGGGGKPGKSVASVAAKGGSASAASSGKNDAVAYAQCMRRNGVPSFPDPKPGQGIKAKPGSALDPNGPQFKQADTACKKYLPNRIAGGDPSQQWPQAEMLKYAQCMRKNGVSGFPDPGSDGGFPPLIKGSGVDPESAQFKKADAACKQYMPQSVRNAPKVGPGGGS